MLASQAAEAADKLASYTAARQNVMPLVSIDDIRQGGEFASACLTMEPDERFNVAN